MTYSRPTCLALIARVESGLTFGQLQPYADALREAVGEVERLKDWQGQDEGEIYRLTSDCEALSVERDDARRVASEAIGEGALRRWEESIRAQQQQAVHIGKLTAERDVLQRKLDAAATIEAASQRTIATWEAAFVEWGKEREGLRSHRDRLAKILEAMRPVVEAACELEDNWRDDSAEEIGSGRLEHAVDAYRAARDGEG